MKFLLRLLCLLLAPACLEPAGHAAPASGQAQISGRKYMRLLTWGRAHHFSVRSDSQAKTVELSNRTARLVFTVDPRKDRTKMLFNGTQISLAFPVHFEKGSTYVSQLDITHTLTPLINPPKNPKGAGVRTVCIDPGHGGKDPGFRVGSHYEKKYALLLAEDVRKLLQAAGFKVVMTRTKDTFVDRDDRTAFAKRHGSDLLVSLHFNAFPPNSSVKGVETYCLTPAGAFSSNSGGKGDTRSVAGNRNDAKNMLLAYHIQRSVVRALKPTDRGVKRARFEVLRDASMPAVLVEGGFMSNPGEGKRIFDPAYRRQMARAIADGIVAYRSATGG